MKATMYNGAGSVDLGDLVMALGNWLPYRYTATGRKWDFLWQDDAAPTTYSAPATFDKMHDVVGDAAVLRDGRADADTFAA